MAKTVGVVGLGIMGSAISRNLIAAGFPVTGYDIDPARLDELRAAGGTPVRSAVEVAAASEIVLTSLPSVAALDESVAGFIAARRSGLIVAELSTLPIDVKERHRAALAAAGMTLLDCPLSGTGAQAKTRDLVVYASGDQDAFERCGKVFAGFARASRYLGAFGNGSKMKFVANLLVAIHNVASAEAMVLGMRAGLDPETIVEVIRSGAGTSRVFELRAPMMAAGVYEPATMKMEIWQKDMALIAEFAAKLGVAAPLFAASAPLYSAAMGQGRGREDTGAVCAVLEQMAGLARGR
jgi:3-hydroxyisobutyrate dehydrogenase-like beta-hydroxyacid dehydrogenase